MYEYFMNARSKNTDCETDNLMVMHEFLDWFVSLCVDLQIGEAVLLYLMVCKMKGDSDGVSDRAAKKLDNIITKVDG